MPADADSGMRMSPRRGYNLKSSIGKTPSNLRTRERLSEKDYSYGLAIHYINILRQSRGPIEIDRYLQRFTKSLSALNADCGKAGETSIILLTCSNVWLLTIVFLGANHALLVDGPQSLV
jgi:hypothetical protein